jgi:Carboxypeptidase regulatory-like domain
MKIHSSLKACLIASLVLALILQTETVLANLCIDKQLKPLKHFYGTVVDSQGLPIPNATVSVRKNGTMVDSRQTNASGEFSLDQLGPGQYESNIEANGFGKLVLPFVIIKPSTRNRSRLRVQLAIAMECSHVELIGR